MAGPVGRRAPAALLSRLVPFTSVALAVLAVDLTTKSAVIAILHEGQRAPVLALGKAVTVTLERSPAFSFSVAAVLTVALVVLAAVAVVGIVRGDRRFGAAGWGIASGLVLGGALGNLVDRFVRPPSPGGRYVVDFVTVGGSPAFNAADVALVLGGSLMLVLLLLGARSGAADDQDESSAQQTDLDPDDEKVALVHRQKYPSLKWDPMPGKPRYLSSLPDDASTTAGTDARGERAPHDPDDLVDEDDRLPGRVRHPANKWEAS